MTKPYTKEELDEIRWCATGRLIHIDNVLGHPKTVVDIGRLVATVDALTACLASVEKERDEAKASTDPLDPPTRAFIDALALYTSDDPLLFDARHAYLHRKKAPK